MPIYQDDNYGILTQEQIIKLYTVVSLITRYLFNIKEYIYFSYSLNWDNICRENQAIKTTQ